MTCVWGLKPFVSYLMHLPCAFPCARKTKAKRMPGRVAGAARGAYPSLKMTSSVMHKAGLTSLALSGIRPGSIELAAGELSTRTFELP